MNYTASEIRSLEREAMRQCLDRMIETRSAPSNYAMDTMLGNCKPQCPPVPATPYCAPDVKKIPSAKEHTMTTIAIANDNTEQSKRQYLQDRLTCVNYNKKDDAKKKFYIDDMPTPKTPKELAERLAAGLYVVTKPESTDDFRYGEWTRNFSWRDPKNPADQVGYDAFKTALAKGYQTALDTVKIGTPAEGLKAVQEFEAATFS